MINQKAAVYLEWNVHVACLNLYILVFSRNPVLINNYRDAESKTEKISKALRNDKFPCQNVISHLYHDTAV